MINAMYTLFPKGLMTRNDEKFNVNFARKDRLKDSAITMMSTLPNQL